MRLIKLATPRDKHENLRRHALQLRYNTSGYDAAYVALADALDCPC